MGVSHFRDPPKKKWFFLLVSLENRPQRGVPTPKKTSVPCVLRVCTSSPWFDDSFRPRSPALFQRRGAGRRLDADLALSRPGGEEPLHLRPHTCARRLQERRRERNAISRWTWYIFLSHTVSSWTSSPTSHVRCQWQLTCSDIFLPVHSGSKLHVYNVCMHMYRYVVDVCTTH